MLVNEAPSCIAFPGLRIRSNSLLLSLNQSLQLPSPFLCFTDLLRRHLLFEVVAVLDGFRVRLTGDYGIAYQIESSSNVIQWHTLAAVTNVFGAVQFTDAGATNAAFRFYRAVTE